MRLTIIIPVDPCKNKFPNQIFVGKIIVLLNHLLSSNSCFCRRNISTTSSWPEIKEIPIKYFDCKDYDKLKTSPEIMPDLVPE